MGAIGGLLGTAGGAGGTGFGVNAPTNPEQLQTSYNQTQSLLNALQGQGALQNQSQVYNQLQQIAQGQGPNPAQAMLNQATGQNVANQAALMAGQRGANANVGLQARQAAQQGANIQQQAAGQGATMQANQQLGAIEGAGNLANSMASNLIGTTTGEQNALLGAQQGYNTQQAGLAQTQLQGGQGLIGGVLGGVGSALGGFHAHGGEIENYAQGGVTGKSQSKFGQFLSGMNQSMPDQSQNPGAQALQKGMSSFGQGIGSLFKSSPVQMTYAGPDMQTNPEVMKAAKGGEVRAAVSPGEGFIRPEKVSKVIKGNLEPIEQMPIFPGKAKVKGDSLKNDIISTKLPAGGIVIPRSVVNSKDPVRGSADFVRAVLAKKKVRG